MAVIVPRWEWRTFGAQFGTAERAFDAMDPTHATNSDELYLLGVGRANVKIRDDLLDIKVLQHVDGAGLEQWMPVMKQSFPIGIRDVEKVFDGLGVETPWLGRDEYSFDQLRRELIEPSDAIRAVAVHKHRVRYLVNGCVAEFSDVVVNGLQTRTIAVESEDAAAVVEAIHGLGLQNYHNTSYPRGLRHLVERTPDRYSVIDVGTNSIKFHVGERTDSGAWRTLVDRAELTRLGEDLDKESIIVAAAAERTTIAIAAMADTSNQFGALATAAVGTAGLRIARNASEVVAEIERQTGITIEVISGEEEGRLAYLAVQASLGLVEGSLVVFDTGGGSTQFTFGEGSNVSERFSVDVGAVRYTEQFRLDGVVTDEVLAAALEEISRDLLSIQGRTVPAAVVGMGGAITNITSVYHSMATYDPDIVQGTILTRDEISRQIDLYRSMDAVERRTVIGLQPKRADVILAGACVVRTVMDQLSQEALTVSDRGLRHGIMVERFGAVLAQ